MTEQEIKETAAESALPITKGIATIQLIGVVAIALSPFILIWGSWQLSGKIALTGILVVLLTWFTSKVVLNVFETIVKDKIKNKAKTIVKKSRWQQKLEEIQERPYKRDDTFISDELNRMLRSDDDETILRPFKED